MCAFIYQVYTFTLPIYTPVNLDVADVLVLRFQNYQVDR